MSIEKQQINNHLLTTKEVCDILKVSRTTLWKLKKLDKLKPIPMQMKIVRYSKEDVENFMRVGA